MPCHSTDHSCITYCPWKMWSKNHTLQVNIGTDWASFGLQEETGRKFQQWSLYNSHRARSLEMDNTDCPSSFQHAQCHAVHLSRITEIAQYTLWYLSRAGLFSHLPSDGCLQSSKFPPTASFLVLPIVPLPPFLKFVELINWLLTLIKNKNMI